MEYLLLIIEYFWIKGVKSFLWTWGLPLITGFLIYCKADYSIYNSNAPSFHSNLISVLGILIGFTISTLTMLLTVNNADIEKAKLELLDKQLFSKQISLFDTVVISLAYIIIIQGLLLIVNFIYPVFIAVASLKGKIFFSINMCFMIHIILVLMRSVLDFYFILTKKNK